MDAVVLTTSQHQDWLEICQFFNTSTFWRKSRFFLLFILSQTNLIFKASVWKRGSQGIILKEIIFRFWDSLVLLVHFKTFTDKPSTGVASLRYVESQRGEPISFNCDVSTSLKQQLNGFYSSISRGFEQGSATCLVRRVHRSTLWNKLYLWLLWDEVEDTITEMKHHPSPSLLLQENRLDLGRQTNTKIP